MSPKQERARRTIIVRSVLLLIAALTLLPFSIFCEVVGIVAFTVDEPMARYSGTLFLVLGGIVPMVGSVVAIAFAVGGLRSLGRFRQLVALLRTRPDLSLQSLPGPMGLSSSAADKFIHAAIRAGIIESRSEQAFTLAPTVPAIVPRAGLQRPAISVNASAAPEFVPVVPHPSMPPIGAVIHGTYLVESLLGKGGMGIVYQVRHVRTGRRYALKLMLADAQLSAAALQRFHREAMAAAAIGHLNIVAVHDFNSTVDGTWFMVMEHLEGQTLAQRLDQRGRLPWPAAREIALQIGDALAAAHDQGLIHRDVKPSNIFLDVRAGSGERAVLLDFGLVKPLDPTATRLTATGVPVGTPLYMAPEQARGEPVDQRCDVYGLAAVVYEMVTGMPPFFDRTLAEVYRKLLTESAPRASTVAPGACPAGLDSVLAIALSAIPAQRHETMRAFVAALGSIPANPPRPTLVL